MSSVRNCAEIGENLQKVMARLMKNQTLLKLLFYPDKDPLSHPDLSDQMVQSQIFEDYIRIVPKFTEDETKLEQSVLIIHVPRGTRNSSNSEFKDVEIDIEVFVPLTEWLIKSSNLRPFAILGEIQKSLDGKTINGLGKMTGGDFEQTLLTEYMSCYTTYYKITPYD